jgi:hypothetical protein
VGREGNVLMRKLSDRLYRIFLILWLVSVLLSFTWATTIWAIVLTVSFVVAVVAIVLTAFDK